MRILEFESLVDNTKIDVELWDCSGKEEYEGCWPAMAYQADGKFTAMIYRPICFFCYEYFCIDLLL